MEKNQFRKQIKLSIYLSIIILFWSSCNESEFPVVEESYLPNRYQAVDISESAKLKINDYAKSFANKRLSEDAVEFDFENLSAVKDSQTEIVTIYAFEKNKEFGNSDYVIGFYEDKKGNVSNPIVSKTTLSENNLSYIEYFTSDGTKLLEYEVNQDKKTVVLTYKKVFDSKSSNQRLATTFDECGQSVADCIGDMYSDYGWDSVALWVSTAFAPEITLIVVGYCGLTVC